MCAQRAASAQPDNSGKVVERISNGSTVLPNPESPLSSSMPSCVRGIRECTDTRASAGMFVRSLEEPRLLSLRGARELALARA